MQLYSILVDKSAIIYKYLHRFSIIIQYLQISMYLYLIIADNFAIIYKFELQDFFFLLTKYFPFTPTWIPKNHLPWKFSHCHKVPFVDYYFYADGKVYEHKIVNLRKFNCKHSPDAPIFPHEHEFLPHLINIFMEHMNRTVMTALLLVWVAIE